jgi:MFS transporter, DHA2 family, methylenomycin A resistance protein
VPVVATAIRAVPPERSGLASGIDNTAHQVGTALGVAIYGAVVGPPARVTHYVTALHILGPAAADAWLAVIVAVLVTWSASRRSSQAASLAAR